MAIRETIEFEPYAHQCDLQSSYRAFSRAFNVPIAQSKKYHDQPTRVRCTPEQFGMFIVLRVIEGVQTNQIINMNIKLIPGDKYSDYVDLSEQEYYPHPFPKGQR